MQKNTFPKVIFGTSGLGNLYVAHPEDIKQAIIHEIIRHTGSPAVFDCAGKYGAGLALESLGRSLTSLNVRPEDVEISNKLGWYRTVLTTAEPTFEQGIWKDIHFDAVQKISYRGILECYHQGNELLGGYQASLVSVHDPDEYLENALNQKDRNRRYQDILGAYQALNELKAQGKVKSIGIGSKDWHIIKEISQDIPLDWVMIANSMTIHSHPHELIEFMQQLKAQGISIINSAVFNAGFLTGAPYYNYKLMDKKKDQSLFSWRDQFFQLCKDFQINPAHACISFGLLAPGVTSIALNTTNTKRIQQNIEMANHPIPKSFWAAMTTLGLIDNRIDFLPIPA